MYCTKCGEKIQNNSTFCTYCGTPIGNNEKKSEQLLMKETAITIKKKKHINIFKFLILGFFILVMGLFLLLMIPTKETPPVNLSVEELSILLDEDATNSTKISIEKYGDDTIIIEGFYSTAFSSGKDRYIVLDDFDNPNHAVAVFSKSVDTSITDGSKVKVTGKLNTSKSEIAELEIPIFNDEKIEVLHLNVEKPKPFQISLDELLEFSSSLIGEEVNVIGYAGNTIYSAEGLRASNEMTNSDNTKTIEIIPNGFDLPAYGGAEYSVIGTLETKDEKLVINAKEIIPKYSAQEAEEKTKRDNETLTNYFNENGWLQNDLKWNIERQENESTIYRVYNVVYKGEPNQLMTLIGLYKVDGTTVTLVSY